MNKLMKALGFKEPTPPEPRKPRLGISLRDGSSEAITGNIEWITATMESINDRENDWITTTLTYPARPEYGIEETSIVERYWIPDVVSYWVDWGDFEPEDEG